MTTDPTLPPRQLLVFCDGTNNTLNGGVGDTNVLKLAQGLKTHNASDTRQIVWYDPGVGAAVNLPEATLWNQFKGYLKRLWGLAFGDGVYENIEQAIGFLARHYQEGDQIYLFGFSRGAFTARAVGGVINQYGLPRPDQLHLLPLLIQRYFSAANSGSQRDCDAVAQARTMIGSQRPFVHFVGVWDTVDEVGLPIPLLSRRIRNTNALADKCFLHVRHVVALDEHRRLFRPRLYQPPTATGQHTARVDGQTHCGSLRQVALPGCHSDVGGGYEACGLSDMSLTWMVNEAMSHGLRVGGYRVSARQLAQPAPVRAHSELNSSFLWALFGQSVRDAGGALTPLVPAPGMPAVEPPVPSVWLRSSGLRGLCWVAAVALTALSYRCLQAAGDPMDMALWQLTAGLRPSQEAPAGAVQHLWRDLGFIASLAFLLSLAHSAGFAYLAGQRRVGQAASRALNAAGLSLPVYIAADLLENVFTAVWLGLSPCVDGLGCVVGLFVSAAALGKCLAIAVAFLLGLAGIWAEATVASGRRRFAWRRMAQTRWQPVRERAEWTEGSTCKEVGKENDTE